MKRRSAGSTALQALLALLLGYQLTLSSCFPARAVTTAGSVASAADNPLYVAIIWHNHQPYYKNPDTGIYDLPWVRLHASKDYYDMAALLKHYPKVHATFNMVPSLIDQLRDYAGGAKDMYQIYSEQPAAGLTNEAKDFILRRFFDANWDKVIAGFPRYLELLEKRGRDVTDASIAAAKAAFTEADFRDLQVLFNLAWIDPGIRAETPALSALVAKGRGFSEEEKRVVLNEQLRLVKAVIPLYRELQATGQIEIAGCPYAHPILPLLMDNALAHTASPDLTLPAEPWATPAEVERQVAEGLKVSRDAFGVTPVGLWPPEMSVSQDILPLLAERGVRWIVADEGVLARSTAEGSVDLANGLRRGATGEVQNPDLLYSAWKLTTDRPLYVLFRDRILSDKIGFSYAGMRGEDAAADLYGRLKAIQAALAQNRADAGVPHIVTIALDGENCWESYDGDGGEFLRAFYGKLQADSSLRAVTVSEYLEKYSPDAFGRSASGPAITKTIAKLYDGSWIDANFETWIGEPDENTAWSALAAAKRTLDEYVRAQSASPSADARGRIAAAEKSLLVAEGSDWFWWYGNDQNSANDEAFDRLFREHLKGVYKAIGQTPPASLDQTFITTTAGSVLPPDLDLGELICAVTDPVGDDNGPGTYVYPRDAVFGPGDFDLKRVEVYRDEKYVSFKLNIARVTNCWNAPAGFSVQTIDIYLRTGKAKEGGESRSLPGRRVTFGTGSEWDYAIWVEGWIQKIIRPGLEEIRDAKVPVYADNAQGVIVVRVPIATVGAPTPDWKFNVLVMGQEGYPPEGNWRVREVMERAAQWRFGGGTNQGSDPNVIDLLVPPGARQAAILGRYDTKTGKLAAIPLVPLRADGAGVSAAFRYGAIAATILIAAAVVMMRSRIVMKRTDPGGDN